MYWWNGAWRICGETGNLYNKSHDWTMTVARTYSSVCYPRSYDTQSFLHELNGGTWKGGILWSGEHWLPV
jgi:hypothetical protein